MIRKRTVFVLGAGASMPYGFPSGVALRHEICTATLMPGDPRHLILIEMGFDRRDIELCRDALARSWASSVDMFIATRNDHREIAKAAIALTIARYEIESDLFFAEKGDWFRYLWRYIHARDPADLPTDTLSFITFNYDRTLEHALYNGLRHAYGKEPPDVANKMPKIVHVYGSLGDYPPMAADTAMARAFAQPSTRENVRASADAIQVISEGSPRSPSLVESCDLLKQAELVVFLGFGYDEDNLRILNLHSGDCCLERECQVIGTGFGLEDAEKQWLQRWVARGISGTRLYPAGPTVDCLQFLRQNSHWFQ